MNRGETLAIPARTRKRRWGGEDARALEAQLAGFTGTPPPAIAAWLAQQGLESKP